MDPEVTLLQSSTSQGRGDTLSPDQDTNNPEPDQQHRTALDSDTHTLPAHTAVDDEKPRSGSEAGALPAAGATATGASQGADASFLDHLFCCPVTKVHLLRPPAAAVASDIALLSFSETVCLGNVVFNPMSQRHATVSVATGKAFCHKEALTTTSRNIAAFSEDHILIINCLPQTMIVIFRCLRCMHAGNDGSRDCS